MYQHVKERRAESRATSSLDCYAEARKLFSVSKRAPSREQSNKLAPLDYRLCRVFTLCKTASRFLSISLTKLQIIRILCNCKIASVCTIVQFNARMCARMCAFLKWDMFYNIKICYNAEKRMK